ncbi:ribbon-helix-helix protein, CopG family [Desulfoscipio geothermicus]|uniref:Ribbon-helix-helix protein, copG family n=1 Tax=Desulfoscipio geothermicus DSM 3669 TaxID=1121426 RepID=A0A1I6E1S8_9FIRM|nr:ribbon-helix-helix protein, CopG family [Desulfoscipio geothermicus]SFR11683.1 Ribbon-helix-helix protein, copG family [Desulfoscipio geothermicus DSM 3669]
MVKTNSKELRVMIDEELDSLLKALAARRGETVSEVVRRLLKTSLGNEAAVDGVDVVAAALTKVIRRELKPVEDRMAKLTAKSAIAGATGLYLNYFVIQQALGPKLTKSAKEVYEAARVKAVAYLKESPPVEAE